MLPARFSAVKAKTDLQQNQLDGQAVIYARSAFRVAKGSKAPKACYPVRAPTSIKEQMRNSISINQEARAKPAKDSKKTRPTQKLGAKRRPTPPK